MGVSVLLFYRLRQTSSPSKIVDNAALLPPVQSPFGDQGDGERKIQTVDLCIVPQNGTHFSGL